MARGPINRHSGLRDGELPRRYLRRNERIDRDDLDEADAYWFELDDYWDPYADATSLDFELVRVWQDVAGVGFAPSLELPAAAPVARPPTEPVGRSDEALVDALFEHLHQVATRATLQAYLASEPYVRALDQIREAARRAPCLAVARWLDALTPPERADSARPVV